MYSEVTIEDGWIGLLHGDLSGSYLVVCELLYSPGWAY